jgi:hypothetical protein
MKERFSKQLRSQRTMRRIARNDGSEAKLRRCDSRIAEILQQVWQLRATVAAGLVAIQSAR